MEEMKRILNLVSEGLRPSKIAQACGTSVALVTQQITKAIQERRVPRSQVLATLDTPLTPWLGKMWRDDILLWVPAWKKRPHIVSPEFIHTNLKAQNGDDFDLAPEEVKLYLLCFERAFKDGEMYEALCEIERTLHKKISMILIEKYGPKETGWWRQGVPKKVRVCTTQKREEDTEFADDPPYSYTTLIDLKVIIEDNQPLFEPRLPLLANDKKAKLPVILKDLTRLNTIRNKVMHPVRAAPPTEEEFFFVTEMQARFELTKWR